jgi:hypothetical protein
MVVSSMRKPALRIAAFPVQVAGLLTEPARS